MSYYVLSTLSQMKRIPRVWASEWFWLVVILGVFVATLLFVFDGEPCQEGYYWEQGFGCIRK